MSMELYIHELTIPVCFRKCPDTYVEDGYEHFEPYCFGLLFRIVFTRTDEHREFLTIRKYRRPICLKFLYEVCMAFYCNKSFIY